MRKLLGSLLVLCLAGAFVAPGTGALAKAKKKKAGPVVVGTDPADDWGSNVDASLAPAGDALGQELVEAQIGMADATTVNFIIKLNSLPGAGGVPEVTRYGWDFSVDGESMLISGAFTELIRTFCYPLHSDPACPPNFGDPQQSLNQPFFVRQGPCSVGAGGVGECRVLAVVTSTFDTATGTITVPIPLEAIGAKPGSKIAPLANASFGGTIYAAPATVVASPNAPHDVLTATETFTVPKKK